MRVCDVHRRKVWVFGALQVPAPRVSVGQISVGGLDAYARLAPHHHVHPTPVIVDEVLLSVSTGLASRECRDRDVDRWRSAIRDAGEAFWSDTDDRRIDVAERYRLAEDVAAPELR